MNHTIQPSSAPRHRSIGLLVLGAALALSPLCGRTSRAAEEPVCPPAPSCASLVTAPSALITKIAPGSHFLFYGDSITKRNQDTPYHYAKLFQHVLARTYRQYCQTPITFALDGEEGRKPYSKGRNLHLAGQIPKGVPAYDWVMVQDSGAPTRPDDFMADVEKAVTAALASSSQVKILLATAPPLDESESVAGNCRRYARGCNWTASNEILRNFVDTSANPRLSTLPLDSDACPVYRQPSVRVTGDGVHLASEGSLVYALSIFQWLGGDLDQVPDCAFTQDDGTPFDAELDNQSGAIIRDTMARGENTDCRMDPSCQGNLLSEAGDCIDYCLEPLNECRPYFNVVAACCTGGACIDFVDSSTCSGSFAGTPFAAGTTCTPDCCSSSSCNQPGTTTTTTVPGPETGACCSGELCSGALTEEECGAAAGSWRGAETICTPSCCSGGNCLPTTTTTSSSTTTSGPTETSSTTTTTLPTCGVGSWEAIGTDSGDQLGAALASVGDLNSDGAPELAAGTPTSDTPHAGGGGVLILDGRNGALLARIPGASKNARTGVALSALGDGHSLIVGSPEAGNGALEGAGRVDIWDLSNPAALSRTATLLGLTPRAHFGATLAAFGDGKRFLAGSPGAENKRGRVDLLLLAGDALTSTAFFKGAEIGDRFGSSLAAFRDGARFVAGSPGHNAGPLPDAGEAAVYSIAGGSSTPPLIRVEGTRAGDALGTAVAAQGSTWLVGTPGSSMDAGRVGIYKLTSANPLQEMLSMAASEPRAEFGSALALLTTNPLTFAVGAPGMSASQSPRAGGLEVYQQEGDELRRILRLEGSNFGDGLGTAATPLGVDALAVSAPGADGPRDGSATIRGGGAVYAHSLCLTP